MCYYNLTIEWAHGKKLEQQFLLEPEAALEYAQQFIKDEKDILQKRPDAKGSRFVSNVIRLELKIIQ